MKLISILLIKLAILLSPCEHVWIREYPTSYPAVLNWNPPTVYNCPICKAKKIITTERKEDIRYD